ncbi:MAG: SRPBCC domain-containing protein [Pseudomonadota bacterium]
MPVLKQTLVIDAPPQEVWRVLTTPELVREWAAAYQDGISIRTSWREGEKVTWKAPDGVTRACGTIAAFRPERLLKFDYTEAVATENRSFSEEFEISPAPAGALLSFTSGPFDDTAFAALKGPAEDAIREIKSLAEESAQIHGLR